jgi:hypothetical protein
MSAFPPVDWSSPPLAQWREAHELAWLDLDEGVELGGDLARDEQDDDGWPGGLTCYACANEARRGHRSPEGLLCTTCWRFFLRKFERPDDTLNGPVTEGFDDATAKLYAMNGSSETEDFRAKRREAVTGW